MPGRACSVGAGRGKCAEGYACPQLLSCRCSSPRSQHARAGRTAAAAQHHPCSPLHSSQPLLPGSSPGSGTNSGDGWLRSVAQSIPSKKGCALSSPRSAAPAHTHAWVQGQGGWGRRREAGSNAPREQLRWGVAGDCAMRQRTDSHLWQQPPPEACACCAGERLCTENRPGVRHAPMRRAGSTCSRRRMRSAAGSGSPSGSWYSASTIFWKVRYSA